MNDRAGDILLYALLLVLPLAALLARRPPLGRTLLFASAWIAIFAIGAVIASQRDRFTLFGRGGQAKGDETRIQMAADGHFWADATINGVPRRMLVDSGATITAISEATAHAAKLEQDSPFPVVLNTANGQITAHTATAAQLSVGAVTTHDLSVVVSPTFGSTDVVGMNFLSQLEAWRVDGRTLILTPHSDS